METGHVFPVEADPAVVETVRTALKAVGMTTGATHTEVRSTMDGPVVIEINARPAGGMIPELVRLATGIDLLEQQLRAVAGLPLALEPARSRVAGIRFLLAPAAGVLARVAGVAEASRVPGVNRVIVTASPGAAVEPARDFRHRLGYVIAVGDGTAAVESSLDSAMDLLRIELT